MSAIEAKRLILAIQKMKGANGADHSHPDKGRLALPTQAHLRAAGLVFQFEGRRLECDVTDTNGNDYPLTIVAMSNREIARAVAEGNADAGIVGYDRLLDIDPLLRGKARLDIPLNFGECNFQLGVDEDSRLGVLIAANRRKATLEDVHGKEIATEHPHALAWIAEQRGVSPKRIHAYTGGVEVMRIRGKRFSFIADLTETGGTMIDNGYIPQEILFSSTASLIRRRLMMEKRMIFEDLKGRLLQAQENLRVISNEDEVSKTNVPSLDPQLLPVESPVVESPSIPGRVWYFFVKSLPAAVGISSGK